MTPLTSERIPKTSDHLIIYKCSFLHGFYVLKTKVLSENLKTSLREDLNIRSSQLAFPPSILYVSNWMHNVRGWVLSSSTAFTCQAHETLFPCYHDPLSRLLQGRTVIDRPSSLRRCWLPDFSKVPWVCQPRTDTWLISSVLCPDYPWNMALMKYCLCIPLCTENWVFLRQMEVF